MTPAATIPLGFEVGTGVPVALPLKHLAITGQTQEAGKTTTLEALITRAGLRAITFVTKRGEASFQAARRIDPYFREQADWQFVASILEASRGEKLKFERAWIIRASRGARTLADVQTNVRAAMEKARGMSADVYLTLDAYLDVVVPQIARIQWAPGVALQPGVNAMDLTGLATEMQHLVIKSTLDWVHQREAGVVVVVPEAWKFIPQGRGTPVKLAAEAFIRQAAGLGSYLWLDSQDLGGIEKTILRSVPVWVLGVQREANEIARTLANIPAGIAKPRPADIATLELGQFYACWGRHVLKTYVQPAWLDADAARGVALGGAIPPAPPMKEEPDVNPAEADALRTENAQLRRQLDELTAELRRLRQDPPPPAPSKTTAPPPPVAMLPRVFTAGETMENEHLYQAIKARLIAELPEDSRVIAVVTARPELRVEVERHVIKVDGASLRGRIARLIAEGFFAQARTSAQVLDELLRRGADRPSNIELGSELKALCEMGFFTRDNKWYSLVAGMAVNVVER
jgi:hypothetical protein